MSEDSWCSLCSKRFRSEPALFSHIARSHSDSAAIRRINQLIGRFPGVCPICKATVKSSIEFIQHTFDSHPGEYLKWKSQYAFAAQTDLIVIGEGCERRLEQPWRNEQLSIQLTKDIILQLFVIVSPGDFRGALFVEDECYFMDIMCGENDEPYYALFVTPGTCLFVSWGLRQQIVNEMARTQKMFVINAHVLKERAGVFKKLRGLLTVLSLENCGEFTMHCVQTLREYPQLNKIAKTIYEDMFATKTVFPLGFLISRGLYAILTTDYALKMNVVEDYLAEEMPDEEQPVDQVIPSRVERVVQVTGGQRQPTAVVVQTPREPVRWEVPNQPQSVAKSVQAQPEPVSWGFPNQPPSAPKSVQAQREPVSWAVPNQPPSVAKSVPNQRGPVGQSKPSQRQSVYPSVPSAWPPQEPARVEFTRETLKSPETGRQFLAAGKEVRWGKPGEKP
jgi:hypothetical protein